MHRFELVDDDLEGVGSVLDLVAGFLDPGVQLVEFAECGLPVKDAS